MKSLVPLVLILCGSIAQGNSIEKIQKCGIRCTKGLHCRAKPHLSFGQCKNQPRDMNTTIFTNMTVSTVMRCEGRQRCSLHLRVSTTLQVSEPIQGITICIFTVGMMERCRTITFPAAARERLADEQVELQDSCLEVAPGQDIDVTLKTLPKYCEMTLTKSYSVPHCSNENLRRHVPECITGRIEYEVDSTRKELALTVSDMLEDKDYLLRLCHKGYTCQGTGARTLLKKEDPFKHAILPYSRPVPCLCIEGWSLMTDAPRVQLCPFENNVEELWNGITFDPVEETLSWEPACHVEGFITLCQAVAANVCQDLPNSLPTSTKEKVTFTTVDPHPQLCMKFTTEAGSWIKCPFTQGNFPEWTLGVSTQDGKQELVVTSETRSIISLSLCSRTGHSLCEESNQTVSALVERSKNFKQNIVKDLCNPNSCIMAKRVDVKYAVTVLRCHFQCSVKTEVLSESMSNNSQSHWELVWLVAPGVALMTATLVATVVTSVAIIVYQVRHIKKVQREVHLPPGYCTGVYCQAANTLTENLMVKSVPHEHHKMQNANNPPFENSERRNLLVESTEDLNV